MKKLAIFGFLVSISLAFYTSCKHEPTQIYTGGNGIDTTKKDTTPVINPPKNDSVCFNTQVLPKIIANCATPGCHDATSKVEGLNLTSYTGVKKIVIANNLNSELIREITRTGSKRMPPPPMAALDTATINMFKKWISQGATNKICIDDCDTTNVKYSTHIAPLVNTYCKGCHQTSSQGGGILLENYTQVKSSVETGKLLCSIKWAGCSNMPKSSSKFSNCNIRKFEIWKQVGFPQ